MASRARTRKNLLYGGLTLGVKAMANPHRLELLDLLAQAPRTVEALAQLAELSVANTSQHLQVLRAAGLVEGAREGSFVTYRLAHDDVADAVVTMRTLAHARSRALDEAAVGLRARHGVVAEVDRADLLKRAERGEVLFLDVRPAEEFAAAHLPRAVSIPVRELKARLAELPAGRHVVAYCRGPYCMFAADAVDVLRDAGFDAAPLSDGVAEWRARGLPLDTSPPEAA
ncbi:MAG: metalloregulator ArsR/SmtB family transcription factor [Deltaproteobacteria bacterium]|nr:metalloregulator ArsR/SmtB family transcription factor [Deltaproteobacteria bacterium]